jgi:putative ubiquitin-RnfH superfamily antitoxin RatB of RatAB toxin-antitoxin module
MVAESIAIEVAYATSYQQTIIAVKMPFNCSVDEAIQASGILLQFPEIDLKTQKIGVFNQVCTLQHQLNSGDRVEIYRPLIKSPMTARRERVGKS